MYLSIIILPLLSAIASGFLGRKVGVKGSQFIACTCIGLTTVFSILVFMEVGMTNIPVFVELFR
jgi:NADH-ubiquinone oxidoreductase chain 5